MCLCSLHWREDHGRCKPSNNWTENLAPAKTLWAKFIYRDCSCTSCMELRAVRTKEELPSCWGSRMLSSWIAQPLWPSAAIKPCSAEKNAEHFLKASCAPCLPAAWKSSGSCTSICHKVVLGLAQHGAESSQKSCLVSRGDYDYYQHSCEDVFCWKMLSRTSVSPGKLTGNGPARSFTHKIFLQLWPILPFLSPLWYNISGWDQLHPCNSAKHYTQLNG